MIGEWFGSIAEGMRHNIQPLDPANGMLDDDPHAGFEKIEPFLVLGQFAVFGFLIGDDDVQVGIGSSQALKS